MPRIKTALLALCLSALAFGHCAAAHAKEMRWPKDGDVFFTFQVPDDWNLREDSPHYTVSISPDKSMPGAAQAVSFGAAPQPTPVPLTSQTFKRQMDSIMSGINGASERVHADPYSSRKPVTVDGKRWDSFITSINVTTPRGEPVTLTTDIMVCGDSKHLLALTFLNSKTGLTPEQQKVLDTLKVTGMDRCPLNEAE
ncbi:MAG: hypothetical protein GC185_10815 [Alphaproteobacteria bacterium]|nr:hypothetical protein [Alphaproteobacteria bacterium]